MVSSATLDTQKSIRDAAEARVAQMQSDIGDRRVRAPFAGVLGIRQISPGTLLTPTTVIATLDDVERQPRRKEKPKKSEEEPARKSDEGSE